jgi:transposase-like protein
MPQSGPRTVRRHSDEFKLTVVRLSQQPGPYAPVVGYFRLVPTKRSISSIVL